MRYIPSLELAGLPVHWMLPIFSNRLWPEVNYNASELPPWMNTDNTSKRTEHLTDAFRKVLVDPPTADETIEILSNIRPKYEEFHNVEYSEEAIKACVTLSNRYISDRFLPDKAIDVMDEVGARVHLKNIHVPDEVVQLERKDRRDQRKRRIWWSRASDMKRLQTSRYRKTPVGRTGETAKINGKNRSRQKIPCRGRRYCKVSGHDDRHSYKTYCPK